MSSAIAADRRADRARVGYRHRDRMHPVQARDLELRRQRENRFREEVPREVRLVSGEEQERATECIGRERQLESWWRELREMVLVERDHRTTRTVVQQRVVLEHHDRLWRCGLAQVVDQTGDRAARIRETGEKQHQRQAMRHCGRIRDAFVDLTGEGHVSMLRAGPDAGARSIMLRANTRTDGARPCRGEDPRMEV